MIPYSMNSLEITVNEQIQLNATGSPTVSGLHYRLDVTSEQIDEIFAKIGV